MLCVNTDQCSALCFKPYLRASCIHKLWQNSQKSILLSAVHLVQRRTLIAQLTELESYKIQAVIGIVEMCWHSCMAYDFITVYLQIKPRPIFLSRVFLDPATAQARLLFELAFYLTDS